MKDSGTRTGWEGSEAGSVRGKVVEEELAGEGGGAAAGWRGGAASAWLAR